MHFVPQPSPSTTSSHNRESSAGYDPNTLRNVVFSCNCRNAFCAFSSAIDAEKST